MQASSPAPAVSAIPAHPSDRTGYATVSSEGLARTRSRFPVLRHLLQRLRCRGQRLCKAAPGYTGPFSVFQPHSALQVAVRGIVRGRFRPSPYSGSPLSPATGIVLNAGAVERDVSLKAVPGVRGPLVAFESHVGVQA